MTRNLKGWLATAAIVIVGAAAMAQTALNYEEQGRLRDVIGGALE